MKITMDSDKDISNYHVVILEDIIDVGRMLNDIVKLHRSCNPMSLRVIILPDKLSIRVVNFTADISLFTMPDCFVIGYGIDCGDYYRNLSYIVEYAEDC